MKPFIAAILFLLSSSVFAETLFPDVPDNTWSTRYADSYPSAFLTQENQITSIVKGNIDTRVSNTWWLVHMEPIFDTTRAITEIHIDGKTLLNCQTAPKGTCVGHLVASRDATIPVIIMMIGLTEDQVGTLIKGKELELVEVALGTRDHKTVLIKPLQGLGKAIVAVKAGHIATHPNTPTKKHIQNKGTMI